MPIIEQGTEEGLRLLDKPGLDLTAPTPDLEIPELPEDRTVLGIQVVPAAKRAAIKLQRRQQDVADLQNRFQISQQVIKTAHALPEDRKVQYLNRTLPSVERVFPGASKQIRTFADDPGGYQNVLKALSNPRQKAIFDAHIKSGDPDSAMKYVESLYKTKGIGSSEFERLVAKGEEEGTLTEEKVRKLEEKRRGVLAGTEMRHGPERSLQFRQGKQQQEFTRKLRAEANEGTEHFSAMETNIGDALAAINAGDNALADTLLAQVLSQVNDTNIRALQMFQQFDKSYGNVAERTINSINRFITGDRSESETAMIKETLENFRDSHVRPGVNKLKTQYRNMAIEEGADPFRVVPPKTPEEIRDYPGIDRDEKIRLLRVYFPEKFK